MKDEIKEILDKLKDTADTSFFAVCGSQEELDKLPKSITKILSIPSKDAKILLDYITNLQEKLNDIKDYVNFLIIFNQTINGKFNETQWGKDILGLIGDDNG